VSQLATGDFGWVQVLNFLVCGVLVLAYAVGLRMSIRGTRGSLGGPVLIALFAASLLVAGVFITDPGLGYPVGAPEVHTTHGLIHGFAGLVAFTLLAASAFVMAWHFSADPQERRWMIYSAAIGLLIIVFFPTSFIVGAKWADGSRGVLTVSCQDDTTRRLPDDQRVLGSYELQLRNLLGVQRHAQLIVEQLQGRRGFAGPTAELLSHIENSDMDAWIASVQAVRAALERESR
jgi:hypothetical protein